MMFWSVVILFVFFFSFSYLLQVSRYIRKFSFCYDCSKCQKFSECKSFQETSTIFLCIASVLSGVIIISRILDNILSGETYPQSIYVFFSCLAVIFSIVGYFTFINIYYDQIKNVKEQENREKKYREKYKTPEEDFSILSKFKINKSKDYKKDFKFNSNTYEFYLPTYVYHDIKKDVDDFIDLMKTISIVLEKTPGGVAKAAIERELKELFSSIEKIVENIKEVKKGGKIYNNYLTALKEIITALTYEDIIIFNKQKFYKENIERLDIS